LALSFEQAKESTVSCIKENNRIDVGTALDTHYFRSYSLPMNVVINFSPRPPSIPIAIGRGGEADSSNWKNIEGVR